ncbi:Hypothetical protein CINCED_3A009142 [Cinara cedri]|uniref:Uncharacterized protein n=1 Tax=Cinara cedri TaxID=506608 RepID=A0A5E4N2D4_9HEMI|nr:Hypothetical protein CINCED_3A009142 [Cinara cedri]
MTTTSMLHTSATRQQTLAIVPGSNEVEISESINAATFEDAFVRATSTPLTDGHVAEEVYCDSANEGLCRQIRDLSINQNPVRAKEGLVEACLHEGPGDLQCTKSAFRRGDAGSQGHI